MGYREPDGYYFTVRNQGAGPAGAFSVAVSGFGTFAFSGLAAGASATRIYDPGCTGGSREARADSLGQVDETDETNNTRSDSTVCLT
jgi:hypothetical protein